MTKSAPTPGPVPDVDGGSISTRRSMRREARVSPPTMRDIAQATGVSQSTVSRVLSGTPTLIPIASATQERVLDAARQLGYRPNPLARGLRGAATMLLGVIVRDITDPFFAGAIEAASVEASRRGYNVVLGHAHESADEAVALWAILEARHCDAILFLGDLRDRPGLTEDLQNTRMPVVALWHGSPESGIPTVSVDNRAGIASVMEHLAGLGHRRVAFAGRKRLGDIREREEAYLAGLGRLGLDASDEYLIDATNDFAGGAVALDRLMDLALPPTAIVASTDVIAIGMLHAAQRRGLDVPRDLSVSGFDDIPVAGFSVPALTTVRMPTASIVRSAVDIAIDILQGRADIGAHVHPVLAPELVVRASTGPVPDGRAEGA